MSAYPSTSGAIASHSCHGNATKKYDCQQYKTYIGLHVKCPVDLSDFNEVGVSWTDRNRTSFYY